MSRKTIHVSRLVDMVNDMLERSLGSPDMRHGMILVLSQVLHETNNYNGFRYLTTGDNVPTNHPVGKVVVDRDEQGNPIWGFPDDTRREYFYSAK